MDTKTILGLALLAGAAYAFTKSSSYQTTLVDAYGNTIPVTAIPTTITDNATGASIPVIIAHDSSGNVVDVLGGGWVFTPNGNAVNPNYSGAVLTPTEVVTINNLPTTEGEIVLGGGDNNNQWWIPS